jgi:hypothetical protein
MVLNATIVIGMIGSYRENSVLLSIFSSFIAIEGVYYVKRSLWIGGIQLFLAFLGINFIIVLDRKNLYITNEENALVSVEEQNIETV